MSKVILYIAISLDGCVADKDGGVGWLEAFGAEGEDYGYKAFLAGVGTIISGSTTYEQALTFGEWSYPDKRFIVLTRRTLPGTPPPGVEFYSGEPEPLIRDLKAQETKHIWHLGGAKSAASYANLGLIDEYIISVMPIILGGGIPLFSDFAQRAKLELVASQAYSSGVIQMTYRPR